MTDFDKPHPITDVELAFPADALEYMPDREFCEAENAKLSVEDRQKWIGFQRKWFYDGLPTTTQVKLKDGIDGVAAFRHLGAIQGSYAPKHEHKEAAVVYLASQWFNDVSYDGFPDEEDTNDAD